MSDHVESLSVSLVPVSVDLSIFERAECEGKSDECKAHAKKRYDPEAALGKKWFQNRLSGT